MDIKNWSLWNNITFRTTNYVKNYDLVTLNDNIITEHEGEISEIRVHLNQPPLIIGEFGISVWNVKLANKFGIDINKLLNDHKSENIYDELKEAIKTNVDIYKYNKVILIQNFILHPKYRKRELSEEFTEFVYRGFYDDNNIIIALVKPLQDNPIDIDFFLHQKNVRIRKVMKDYQDVEMIPAKTYYSIDDLFKKTDREMNEYKIFAVANKCGFSRINDSYLFALTPDKIIKRILEKREIEQKNNGLI